MEGHVSWVNEVAVKDGKLETFRELMEEMVSGTRNEPGTLAYEWYISRDGGTVNVVETYADSAAVVAHHVSEGFALKNWAVDRARGDSDDNECRWTTPVVVRFGRR